MSERVAVVDDRNRFVRWAHRPEIHAGSLPHRSVQVLLFDSTGRLVVQRRAHAKLTFPGCWDVSASGHVEESDYPDPSQPDEGLDAIYDAVAARELEEELGVRTSLERLDVFAPLRGVHYEHFVLYRGASDGPYVPQPEEVAEVRALTGAELDALAGSEPVTRTLTYLARWARRRRLFPLGGHGPPGSRSALAHPPVSSARVRERQLICSPARAPMSDLHDSGDDERTDPHIGLPAEGSTGASDPRAAPSGAATRAMTQARATTISSIPARVPPRASTPAQRASSVPPRPLPPPARLGVAPVASRPPSVRPGSIPPSPMPKPSDAPPAMETTAIQRQRLAQMETSLDQARSTMSRQRNELDELRARIAAGDARLDELLATLRDDGRSDALERRLADLEASRDSLANELARRRDDDAPSDHGKLARIAERLRTLEEGTGEARIRMRLERAGHRIEDLERRLAALEASERATAETVRSTVHEDARRDERLGRLESYFEELAEELQKERQSLDLDGMRARLDDVETLVLKTGGADEGMRRRVADLERELAELRSAGTSAAHASNGDDLTNIKGIGPKYARILHEMGVRSYTQVAAWTDDDVERAAERLGIPAARIRKAGWIEAAARLAG